MAYETLKLPRLPIGWDKQPQLFERYWDEAMTSLERSINGILQLPAIEAAIAAANAAAAAANTAATGASSAATTAAAATAAQKSQNSLINSYVPSSSFTAPLITVTAGGLVTIKTHTRTYGDTVLNPTVSVTGGSFTAGGVVANDVIRVYYNDPTRAGGAVTYLYTLDPATPPVQGGNVHSVGAVIVPAAGTAPGKNLQPPGFVEQ